MSAFHCPRGHALNVDTGDGCAACARHTHKRDRDEVSNGLTGDAESDKENSHRARNPITAHAATLALHNNLPHPVQDGGIRMSFRSPFAASAAPVSHALPAKAPAAQGISPFVGTLFATASGKPVVVSDAALKKARLRFRDDENGDDKVRDETMERVALNGDGCGRTATLPPSARQSTECAAADALVGYGAKDSSFSERRVHTHSSLTTSRDRNSSDHSATSNDNSSTRPESREEVPLTDAHTKHVERDTHTAQRLPAVSTSATDERAGAAELVVRPAIASPATPALTRADVGAVRVAHATRFCCTAACRAAPCFRWGRRTGAAAAGVECGMHRTAAWPDGRCATASG